MVPKIVATLCSMLNLYVVFYWHLIIYKSFRYHHYSSPPLSIPNYSSLLFLYDLYYFYIQVIFHNILSHSPKPTSWFLPHRFLTYHILIFPHHESFRSESNTGFFRGMVKHLNNFIRCSNVV